MIIRAATRGLSDGTYTGQITDCDFMESASGNPIPRIHVKVNGVERSFTFEPLGLGGVFEHFILDSGLTKKVKAGFDFEPDDLIDAVVEFTVKTVSKNGKSYCNVVNMVLSDETDGKDEEEDGFEDSFDEELEEEPEDEEPDEPQTHRPRRRKRII